MLYSYFVEKSIRQSFDHVNNHRWDEAVKAVAPNVHHRVSGAHALGGERHDKEALRRWFERLGRVLPTLHLTVNNIWVTGWPWHTTVFAQWDGTATLLNGDASYVNRGLHVFTLRWGRVSALEEFQDSQAAARALAAQAAAGLEESCRRTNCELAEAQSEAHAFRRLILAGTGPSGGEGMAAFSPQVLEIIGRPNSTAADRMLELFFSPHRHKPGRGQGMAGAASPRGRWIGRLPHRRRGQVRRVSDAAQRRGYLVAEARYVA